MDVKILKAVLIRGGAFTASKSTIPILQSVRLSCRENILTAESSNLEAFISSSAEVADTPDFDSCVPARTLLDLASVLTGDVSLTFERNSLIVKTESGTTRIHSSDPAEFPPMPGSNENAIFLQLPFATLAEIATRVAFCVSDDEARPVLGGVHIHAQGRKLVAAATDGFRISTMQFDSEDNQFSVNIPAGTLIKAAKMLIADKDGTIAMTVEQRESGAMVIFSDQWTKIATATIAGNYPDYNQIIAMAQRQKTVEFEVSVRELKSAIAQLGVIAESGHLATIEIAESHLEAEVKNSELGIGKVKLLLRNEVAKRDIFGVNLRFLDEALSATTGEWVKFTYSANKNPFQLTGSNSNHTMLIMPMQVG